MKKNIAILSFLAVLPFMLQACGEDEKTTIIDCNNGEIKCENGVRYGCQNETWKVMENCANGCDGGVCKAVPSSSECTSGKKCEDNTEFVCISNVWNKVKACPAGCAGETCKAAEIVCTAGQTKCENSIEYACADNAWNELRKCPDGCNGQICKVPGVVCTAGQTKCEDNAEYACADNAWNKSKDCPDGCDGSVCKAAESTCTNEQTKCEDNVEYVCAGNAWNKSKDCPDGCDGNVCKAAETACTDGQMKCENNAEYACAGKTWGKTKDCPKGCDNGVCVADEPPAQNKCKADDTKCENSEQYRCIEGEWSRTKTCMNGCDGKLCKEIACQDRCEDSKTLMHCNDDGTTVKVTCKDGCSNKACKNGYVEPLGTCAANTDAFCMDDSTAFECSDFWDVMGDGVPVMYKHHCPDNRTCKNGRCIVSDADKCSDNACKDLNTLLECKEGKFTEKKCAAGEICFERQCIADKFKSCKSDSDCASDQSCYQGLCYLKSNFDYKLNDECDPSVFQEYCKDGNEYKCAILAVVTEETCPASGCDCEAFFAENPDIQTCSNNSDCKEANTLCYDKHCYPRDQFKLNPGDDCRFYDFNLYCKGGKQYYCKPDAAKRITAVDCSTKNGCTTFIKLGRDLKTGKTQGYANATCRGTDEELATCTQPGIVHNRCETSIDYQLSSVCINGIDGQSAYFMDYEQNQCDGKCDNSTGMCKK